MISPGSKLAPPEPGGSQVTRNNSNREGEIHFVGKVTQVSDPGPSWPLATDCCNVIFSDIEFSKAFIGYKMKHYTCDALCLCRAEKQDKQIIIFLFL